MVCVAILQKRRDDEQVSLDLQVDVFLQQNARKLRAMVLACI
jgi:hypothetical protein